MADNIKVEVVYAGVNEQKLLSLFVERGCPMGQAIEQSGLLKDFPEINLDTNKVGVFGKIKALNYELVENDRVEIYRPLLIDPKIARLERVKKK